MQSSLPTAERLRLAVAAGSYGEVQELLTEFSAEIESRWRASSEAQRRLIAREGASLLDWARRTILAKRSHTQQRQVQLVRQSAYAKAGIRRSTVELNA